MQEGIKLADYVRVAFHIHWNDSPSFQYWYIALDYPAAKVHRAENKTRRAQRHVSCGALHPVASMTAEADIDWEWITTHQVRKVEPPVSLKGLSSSAVQKRKAQYSHLPVGQPIFACLRPLQQHILQFGSYIRGKELPNFL